MCIMAPLVIGAVLYILWLCGSFLPKWIVWERGILYDSSKQYEIVLEHKKVEIRYDNSAGNDDGLKSDKGVNCGDVVDGEKNDMDVNYNGGAIWTSPKGVKVQKILSADIDGDHEDELLLLCWKIGRYGRSKPFWISEDEKKWSQHIFVYEFDDGEVRPKWMSSYMGQDVAQMEVWERDQPEHTGQDAVEMTMRVQGQQAGRMVKILRERLLLTAPDGKVSSWIWDSWGFTREDTEVSFVVFGDNLIHEPIYNYGLHNDGDFGFLYENMKEIISESDISVINQETPLTDNPAMYGDYPRFGTPVQVGEAMADAGFDVVTCATNHALDRGSAGANFTKKFFDGKDIVCLGIQTTEEKEYVPYDIVVRNGIRFAMFNYTYSTGGIRIPDDCPNMVHLFDDEERIREDIESARAESDLVIVFAHWGTEYEEEPDDFQMKWTNILLESGVDVVVGTHPHALQPYEVLRDNSGHEMLVYYSIGNYISAQPVRSCVKGGMAEFTVSLTPDGYRITEYGLRSLKITWQESGKYMVELVSDY